MTHSVGAVNGKGDPYVLRHQTMSVANVLGKLASSAWALSCASFLMTALLIRSNGLTVL